MTNPFEAWSEVSKPVWQQKREAAVAKRQASAKAHATTRLERELGESDALLSGLKAAQKQQMADLLAGPHGRDIKRLRYFLRGMELNFTSAAGLVQFVKEEYWLQDAPQDVRYAVLKMISHAIVLLREREGLEPFNDGLPFGSEPPTAFDAIKAMIGGDL